MGQGQGEVERPEPFWLVDTEPERAQTLLLILLPLGQHMIRQHMVLGQHVVRDWLYPLWWWAWVLLSDIWGLGKGKLPSVKMFTQISAGHESLRIY